MKDHRSSLLLTELVLDLLIFAVCTAVCAALLVRAWSVERESTRLTDAVYIAQTAAEELSALPGEQPGLLWFTSDGKQAENEATADYTVAITYETAAAEKGSSVYYSSAELTVYPAGEKTAVYTLDTAFVTATGEEAS